MTLVNFKHNSTPANSFNHLLNDIFGGETITKNFANRFYPAVNIKEDNKAFEIAMAVPGINKDEIKVAVEHDVLTISYEHKNEANEQNENYTRREYSYQSFSRSFTLPKSADADKIAAVYTNGELMLTIPKKEAAKPLVKEITVS